MLVVIVGFIVSCVAAYLSLIWDIGGIDESEGSKSVWYLLKCEVYFKYSIIL